MPRTTHSQLSVGQCATLACLLEVSVPKPGNVHRGADFEDVTFLDFAISAVAIGPAIESAHRTGVGPAVLAAVRETQRLVHTNTNLGTLLLLAPMAAVARDRPVREGIALVLNQLAAPDASAIYEAIRVAHPGGMGQVADMDIGGTAPENVLDAMRAAADHDLVAHQYTHEFATVFDEVVPNLVAHPGRDWSLADTIIQAQLRLMSRYPDSLIARKCGPELARESAARADRVLGSGDPGSSSYVDALGDFDFWLRSDHHRRNPGTTADLIAAGLFVVIRDGLPLPAYAW